MITFLNEAESSSNLVLDKYNNNCDEFTTVVVDHQTNGRGRRGKSWFSPKGNLYFSTLVIPKIEFKFWPQLSFVSSLAVRSAINSFVHNDDISINYKWPNDILIDCSKVSGILIETTKDNKALVVGIGINLISNPKKTKFNWQSTNINDCLGIRINPKGISKILLKELINYIQLWYENGFSYIKSLWIKNAIYLNEELNSIDLKKNIKGVFVDIGECGQILLKDDSSKLIESTSGTFVPTNLMDNYVTSN